MKTSESIQELLPALIAARQAFAPIRRESTAQIGQNRSYSYADLATLVEAVLPPLLDRGLLMVQVIDAETATLVTRLVHVSGQWIETRYPLDLSQAPQQLGSAMTYGRRYSLQALLCLAAEDDDGAAAQPAKRSARDAGSKPSKAIKATADGPQPVRPADVPPARPPALGTISPPQVRRLWSIADARGWPRDAVRAWLIATYSVPSSSDILVRDYDQIMGHLESGPPIPDADIAF